MYKDFLIERRTRTEKTINDYKKWIDKLTGQARRWFLANEPDVHVYELSNSQLVYWLLNYSSQISKATYRLYKSAIVYKLETDGDEELCAYLLIHGSDASYGKDQSVSKKSKSIKEKDWVKLIEFLENSDYKWDKYLYDWMSAGVLCGLRPMEWTQSEIIDYNGQPALKVKNAKNTNGRANGDYRILLLSNMSKDEYEIVERNLKNIKMFYDSGAYDDFYNECRERLCQLNKRIFGHRKKHITLYTARHQFSANAKFSGKSRSEVAALMGHGVDRTASIHYGKKRFGRSKVNIEPVQEQVESVRQTDNSFYLNRLRDILAKKEAEKLAKQNQQKLKNDN